MDDCEYHPGEPGGIRCQKCYDEYENHMMDLEEEAWRDRRS